MTNDTQKLVDKYNKSVQSIQEQELAIDKVKQKLDRLSLYKNSGVILTDSELAELDNLPRKLDLMNSKLNDTKLNTSELGNQINESLNQKHFDLFGGKIDEVGKKIDKFKNKISKLIGSAMVFSLLRNQITSLRNDLISLLKTDNQFASSLNQVKANLMTSFAPIYNACLPAINNLINALSKLTGTLAMFVSNLLGVGISNATKDAKKLSSALNKVNGSAKKASGSLGSFDHLEVIPDSSSSGSDSSKDNQIDYNGNMQFNSKLLDFLNRLKESLSGIDFTNLNNSLETLKEKLSIFGDNVGDALWWIWENILVPLAKWTISDVLPSFLDILSGALSILNQACDDLKPIWEWFWNNFLKPIAEWTGGVIVDVLNGIGNALQWISENEVAMAILEGIAIAIGLVAAAIGIYNGVMAICNIVTGIFSGIMAFLTSPITLVVLAIGALIAIIILCVKHWDDIKNAAMNTWENIKSAWNTAASWFNDNIVTPIKDFFVGLWNGVVDGVTIAVNKIKSIFGSIVNFFSNIISKILGFFRNIGVSVGNVIASAFRGVVNGVLNAIEKILNFPLKSINKLINIINKIPGINLRTLPTFNLPRLAKGAVIPPRQEFAAILGDQKHGTNIEAPLDTIKQANREVLEEVLGRIGINGQDREIVLKNWQFILQFGNTTLGKILIDEIKKYEKETNTQFLLS